MTQSAPRRYQNAHPRIPDDEKRVKLPLDALIKPLSPILTDMQQAQLRREFSAYWQQSSQPVTVYNHAIDLLGELAFPALAPPQRRQGVGYELVRGAPQSSIITRVVVAPLRVMNPVRFFQYIPQLAASVLNYGTVITWEEVPQHWTVELIDQPLYLEYIQGNFQAMGIELLKVPTWAVHSTTPNPGHHLLTITW